MRQEIDITGYTDEELLRKYTVEINGRKFVRASVKEAIDQRHALLADRKPGDPGTVENPIFKNGHAFIYNSRNRLSMWEDYNGVIPQGEGIIFRINPETTEVFTLTPDMIPTERQKKMIREAQKKPVNFTEDCPKSTPEQLERFRRFGKAKKDRNNSKLSV